MLCTGRRPDPVTAPTPEAPTPRPGREGWSQIGWEWNQLQWHCSYCHRALTREINIRGQKEEENAEKQTNNKIHVACLVVVESKLPRSAAVVAMFAFSPLETFYVIFCNICLENVLREKRKSNFCFIACLGKRLPLPSIRWSGGGNHIFLARKWWKCWRKILG